MNVTHYRAHAEGHVAAHRKPIAISTLGTALSIFLAVSFVFCIAGYLLFPSLPIAHAALSIFLPGFTLLSWSSFLLGLVESVIWGWYIAVVFGAIYNAVARRW
ncbi:DUF5676 family membrane protein [Dyella sp. BiH032]|uniref:DUF5676 family membrane protein n=1 Tax=Dyella sp. BiH032 TaxID=3075430 RepID=UPI0028933386|nr:DUF5676 family membrane protein [Dyella sp. BiH032]WNL45324.1 DUF5676 family membrane protein [Dyella sp. BiH032]